MTPMFVALCAGICAASIVFAIAAPARRNIDVVDLGYTSNEGLGSNSFFERYVRPAVHNFLPQTPMAVQAKARNSTATRELLIRSGNPWNVTAEEFMGIRLLGAVVGLAAGFVCAQLGVFPDMLPPLLWALVGLGAGYAIPKVRLSGHAAERQRESQKQAPEALDLLQIAMGSAREFQEALRLTIGAMTEGTLRTELQRVSADLKANVSVVDALTEMARRAPSQEVEALAKAIIQGAHNGADITSTLERQADAARSDYEALVDGKTAKLAQMLMLPIMVCMLPALMIVFLAPNLADFNQVF